MGFEQLEDCKRADENHVGEATPGQQVDLHLSLVRHAASVLLQPDPHRKADQTRVVANLWKNRQIIAGSKGSLQLCDRPSRDDSRVKVVAPGKVPGLGKGGSLASRQAILHSLVHIESWAVDLSWDIVARFGCDPNYALPDAFVDDFVQVAYDEASHFQQLQQRLEAIGSHYGALPVHDGLWESAAATAHSLPARLAVESCVHEARGLDRLPHTIHRFRNAGDHKSAELLETIYQEEIAHCGAGVRWLTYLHSQACSVASEQAIAAQLQNVRSEDSAPGNGLGSDVSTLNSQGRGHAQSDDMPGSCLSRGDSTKNSNGSLNAQSTRQLVQSAVSADTESASAKTASCANEPDRLRSGSSVCHQSQSAPHVDATNGNTFQSKQAAKGSIRVHDWQADAQQYARVEDWFHALVRANFKGSLKPPFNEAARAAAGFGPGWYLPLSTEVLK